MSKRFGFGQQKGQAAPPVRKDEAAPARAPEPRAQPPAAAKEARTAPAPAPSPAPASAAEPPKPSPEQIAVRAYELWESEGRPEGADVRNWLEAERRLSEGTR